MSHCDDNLAKIYQALKVYQDGHEGRNPAELLELDGVNGLTLWDFLCPASSAAIGQTAWTWRGGDLHANVPGEMVLAYDAGPVHKGRRNVLFTDGTVKRPPDHFLKRALVRDNELRREYGLQEKPEI